MERFVSYLGTKDVMSLRISKEIKMLLIELTKTKDSEGMSQGEIIEAALYKAFLEGLLCNGVELKRIRDQINSERTKTIAKF
jgi:hypothetical protein